MEPTPIVPPVVVTSPNKSNITKVIIIILALAFIIVAIMMMKNKTEAPTTGTENSQITTQQESNQLSADINSATTINNEADLSTIDKQF